MSQETTMTSATTTTMTVAIFAFVDILSFSISNTWH